jgi:glutathione S-transferase
LESGHRVLGVMEAQLAKTPFIAGDVFTVADIALYAYTHSAGPRGGFEMERFPKVNEWLRRCADDAGHVPIEWGCD